MANYGGYPYQYNAPSAPPMTGSSAWQRPQSPAPGTYPQGYGQAYPPTAPPVAYGGGGYFPPGTPPDIVSCFQRVDRDFSGFIDERELQAALCSGYQQFSMRTVRLLMFLFNSTGDSSKIGPNEFVALWTCLGQWRAIFERVDRDRSGKIDAGELQDALLSLGYAVPPTVLQVLLSRYQNNDQYGMQRVLNFDSFVECGLIIKGLTDKFKEKDPRYTGSATISYDSFMLMIIPFIAC